MVKTLQEKIDSLLSVDNKKKPAKLNVTYYLSREVVEAFRGICEDKKIMSSIVETLIEDFVKERIAYTLATNKFTPKETQRQKKKEAGAKEGPRRVVGERVVKRRGGR